MEKIENMLYTLSLVLSYKIMVMMVLEYVNTDMQNVLNTILHFCNIKKNKEIINVQPNVEIELTYKVQWQTFNK